MSSTIQSEQTATIANRNGLHARPAAEFVKLANNFKADIFVRKEDLEVNGKSILGLMMLAAECGAVISIRAAGEDAERAVGELVGLIAARFGED